MRVLPGVSFIGWGHQAVVGSDLLHGDQHISPITPSPGPRRCLQTAEVMVVCRHQDYRLGPFPISLVVDVLVHAHSNPHHSPRVHSLHWIALHFVSVSLVGLELCNKNWDDTIHLTLVLLPLLEWPVSLCMVPLSWVGYSFAWTPLHTPSLQAEPGHILYVHLWVA